MDDIVDDLIDDVINESAVDDLLTCGDCQKEFRLRDILAFIHHKVSRCNQDCDNGDCDSEDFHANDRNDNNKRYSGHCDEASRLNKLGQGRVNLVHRRPSSRPQHKEPHSPGNRKNGCESSDVVQPLAEAKHQFTSSEIPATRHRPTSSPSSSSSSSSTSRLERCRNVRENQSLTAVSGAQLAKEKNGLPPSLDKKSATSKTQICDSSRPNQSVSPVLHSTSQRTKLNVQSDVDVLSGTSTDEQLNDTCKF